jgi:hypothetical protein
MDAQMREIRFSQTHRRTHKQRHFIVSQFEEGGMTTPSRAGETTTHVASSGLAWHYVMQTETDGAWTKHRKVNVALDAPDEEVALTVARDLASPGWDRDRK